MAAYDASSGVTYDYGPATRFHTASTIKVAILGALLRQAQDTKRPLTANQRSLAERMIEFSDNAATDVLWGAIGRGPGLASFMAQIGMRQTVPGPGPGWSLTETTTVDLTMLMRAVAYPNSVLTNDSRVYILQLMSDVTSSQRWGVSAAVRPGERVALKNGWMVVQNIWGINGMGRLWGSGRDFVIAVLTNGSPTKNIGIATVEGGTRIAVGGL
ncbi:MAG TPA: serine hydrolase [Pseudonocardiaceae bacterium]|nr:serine hydrolase [Pseudonocardiaceae bacterium]